MRSHMYAYGYRNLELALTTHTTVPGPRGLTACRDCGECMVRCPRRLDVPGRLAELRTLVTAHA
jgi:predicted aldo/keto reductase-like oxidoreductase